MEIILHWFKETVLPKIWNKLKIVLLRKKLPYILETGCAKYYSLDVNVERMRGGWRIESIRFFFEKTRRNWKRKLNNTCNHCLDNWIALRMQKKLFRSFKTVGGVVNLNSCSKSRYLLISRFVWSNWKYDFYKNN